MGSVSGIQMKSGGFSVNPNSLMSSGIKNSEEAVDDSRGMSDEEILIPDIPTVDSPNSESVLSDTALSKLRE